MGKRLALGLVVSALAVGSFGCTTLRRAGDATSVEEVDMLADVELTEEEALRTPSAPPPAERPHSVDVHWEPNGRNIQLAKLPPVKPVTASMLSLGKHKEGLTVGRPEAEAPPRGLPKVDASRTEPAR